MTARLILLPPVAPSAGDPSDEALIASCARGDLAALGHLFDRRADELARFIGRLLGSDGADVEDLLHMTFIEALRAAPRFKGDATARTWLFAIAANLAGNQIRGKMRRRQSLSAFSQLPQPNVATPGEIAERRQLMDRLAHALGGLKHDLRVAFMMCDVEELAGVEVARVLGIPPGTLWRRLHEARKELRSALEET